MLGGPDERRRFLDIACSLENPAYYRVLLNYNRALRQRNMQLKNDLATGKDERSIWNESLAQYGLLLMASRERMTAMLLEFTKVRLAAMPACSIDFAMEYKPNLRIGHLPSLPVYHEALQKSRTRENIFRTTVVGPHRDTLVILDGKRSMRDYASQGQNRLAVIALKLALVKLLEEQRGTRPVLLFDDILLEIDAPTCESILETFGSSHQLCFTSTTVPDLALFRRWPGECFFRMERK